MKANREQMERHGHKMLVADVCRCGDTVYEPVKRCGIVDLKVPVSFCAKRDCWHSPAPNSFFCYNHADEAVYPRLTPGKRGAGW